MKLVVNVLAVVVLCGGVLLGVTGSSGAASPTRLSAASIPTGGCTVLARSPDFVEQCGQCTILGAGSQDALLALVRQIARASTSPVWFTVGNHWVGSNDNTDLAGAVDCADRYGGTVERFTD